MRARIIDSLMRKVADAVYTAWMQEQFERGVNAQEAHAAATKATELRMQLLKEAWLTVDWLPPDNEYHPVDPCDRFKDPLVRRLWLSGR